MKLPVFRFLPDQTFRTPAEQMAMDQAVFELTRETAVPSARFYHWDTPAVTVGYFHRFDDEIDSEDRPIRRFTGGGKVEHGEDATFVICFPANSPTSRLNSDARYRWIHTALAAALVNTGYDVELESTPTPSGNGPCFSNSVTWDLKDSASGEKIGGGAQRRSAGAVMHQGSVRLPASLRSPHSPWIPGFLNQMAENVELFSSDEVKRLTRSAENWNLNKFATAGWNKWPSPAEA